MQRLIKDYIITPFIIGLVLFAFLHWLDSEPKALEKSLVFGLQFAAGFALVMGIGTIGGIKFLRPILTQWFSRHKNLEALTKHGFKWNENNNTYEGTVDDYDSIIFYTYEEMNILQSQYHIVVKFKHLTKEQVKLKLKPQKHFAKTVMFGDFIQGHHEFYIFPTSTDDLIEDVKNFIAYLKKYDIEPK